MSPPRIFFDANSGTMEHGYWLGFDQSKIDLQRAGPAIAEGARVIIYTPDELEMLATLRFDEADGFWWADPVLGTIKYLDGSG